MTTTYQVTCHIPDNNDADRRIQGLGGPSGGGWTHGIDALIEGIENRRFALWTTTNAGESVWVTVAKRANGRKYLKTEADGIEPNNLLELPFCR